jgi:hypothetical protein
MKGLRRLFCQVRASVTRDRGSERLETEIEEHLALRAE